MTAKRLEELKKKFADSNGNTDDLGEILADFFQTMSGHMKDVKKQMSDIQATQQSFFKDLQDLKIALNPIYTIVNNND